MRMSRFESMLGLATLLALAVVVFDYSGIGREPVQGLSGTVRIGGKPMARGMVRFISIDGDSPWAYGGYVSNGRYEVPEAEGLGPAKYVVEFSSIRSDEVDRLRSSRYRGEEKPEPKEEIPAQYNLRSEVRLDLSSGTVLEADFDLD